MKKRKKNKKKINFNLLKKINNIKKNKKILKKNI